MALKPLPRLIIIVAFISLASYGFVKWRESRPVDATTTTTADPQPSAQEQPPTANPHLSEEPTPTTVSVTSGTAGLANIRKHSNKKEQQ